VVPPPTPVSRRIAVSELGFSCIDHSAVIQTKAKSKIWKEFLSKKQILIKQKANSNWCLQSILVTESCSWKHVFSTAQQKERQQKESTQPWKEQELRCDEVRAATMSIWYAFSIDCWDSIQKVRPKALAHVRFAKLAHLLAQGVFHVLGQAFFGNQNCLFSSIKSSIQQKN